MSKAETTASHYMQSAEWAALRADAGWGVHQFELSNGKIYSYSKKTPFGSLVYVPGYIPQSASDIMKLKDQLPKNSLSCKLETCSTYDQGLADKLTSLGWQAAKSIQYSHTVRLALDQSEQELWMSLKARARQEVNYARRDGVTVEFAEPNDDQLSQMYDLLQQTSRRKEFGIRERQVMMKFWKKFADTGKLHLAWARHDQQIIAGGVFITNGVDKIWYKDAGSRPEFAKLFAPRLLLWEAAVMFQKQRYRTLDLSGIPDPNKLENSPMKGIYTFKTAFSREIVEMMPAYELPLKPNYYRAWSKLEPIAIKVRRHLSTLAGNLRGSRR